MNKLKIHPAFWAFAALAVWQGQALACASLVLASLLHELAHAKSAKTRGYALNRVVLLPTGAVLLGEETIQKHDAFMIAAAGPIASGLLAVFTMGLWWLCPALYSITKPFCDANVMLALFNSLPIFPLDGARMLLSAAKRQLKMLRVLRALGLVFSLLLFLLFVLSLFFTPLYHMVVMAIFVAIGALGGTKQESYRAVSALNPTDKDPQTPVLMRTMVVTHAVKLQRLLACLRQDCYTTFLVHNQKNALVATLTEREVQDLCIAHGANARLKDCLSL